MIECKSKYYRVHLKTAEDKAVYDLILTSLITQQCSVRVSSYLLVNTSCSLETLVLHVRMDNPGLFYVDFQNYHFADRFHNKEIAFSYLYPVSKIESVERKISDKIKAVVQSNNIFQLTPYERELALHDYLVKNVVYEHTDKSYHKAHSAVGALLHGRAVCEGYSMAFKLLCDAAGVSCIVLFGTATNSMATENHAWNIVKINEKCYHIDVTWDACAATEFADGHNCFNLTDDDISQDHTWDKKLLPKCTSLDDNYFVRSDYYFTSSAELRRFLVQGLKNGQRVFSARINHKFKDDSRIESIINESIGSLITNRFLGYSYQYQYDVKRDVVNISVNTL
jgi:hypothetical protein